MKRSKTRSLFYRSKTLNAYHAGLLLLEYKIKEFMIERMKYMVSIIVPVHNTEKYIRKCVESLIGQTFTDLEVILVDDGSTDSSGEICEKIAKTDNRIHVFHINNSGVAYARNFGLEKSSGEYIMFVDADDYLDSALIETYYLQMQRDNSDIVIGGFLREEEGKQIGAFCIPEETISGVEAVKRIYDNEEWFYPACWGKIYRRSIFDKIRFRPLRIGEDADIAMEVFFRASKISCIPYTGYHYVGHKNNTIKSKNYMDDLIFFDCRFRRLEFLKDNPVLPKALYYKEQIHIIVELYRIHSKDIPNLWSCEEWRKVIERASCLNKEILINPYLSIKEKIFWIMFQTKCRHRLNSVI